MTRARVAILSIVALAAVGAASLGIRVARLASEPLPLAAPITVLVAPGSSVRAIGQTLTSAGALADPADLVWAARWWGEAPLKAGEYRIEPGGSVRDLLHQLERGDVLLHAFTIVEGTTVRELRRALAADDSLVHTLEGVPDERLLVALGAPAGHPEGRFLPETYRFPRGTTDADFLRRAMDAASRALASAWAGRAPGLPLDRAEQLLTLASVVEKETGVPEERSRIAGVFVRRLQQGMRLQTDPTVIYGLGERYDGNLRKQDLMTDTPYNTYTRRGLPPTPICLPSRAALEAAAHPAAGDELYFVATGDGGHAFSATLEQHNAAVASYLKRLRQQRRGAP